MDHLAQEHKKVFLEFAGRRRELLPGASTMGRSHRCEVVLPDPSASRQHALISLEGGRVTVQDLGSSNGTLVNGSVTQGEVEIQDGDLVLVGETEVQVRILDVERSETVRLPALTQAAQTTRTQYRPDGGGLDGPTRSEAVAMGEAMPVGEVLAEPSPSWDATGIISPPRDIQGGPTTAGAATPVLKPKAAPEAGPAATMVAPQAAFGGSLDGGPFSGGPGGGGNPAETSFADISQELAPLEAPEPLPPLGGGDPMAGPASETIAVPSLPFPPRSAKAPAAGRPGPSPAPPPGASRPSDSGPVPRGAKAAPGVSEPKDPAARSQTLPIPNTLHPDETGEVLPSLAEIEERIGAVPPAPAAGAKGAEPRAGAKAAPRPAPSRPAPSQPAPSRASRPVPGLYAAAAPGTAAPSFAPAAGFWIRAGAYLLDSVWMALFAAIATFLAGGPESALGPLVGSAVGLALFFLVPVVGWTMKGTTPAKALLGLHVYDVDGNVGLPFGRSLLRWLGYLISAAPLFLGFFMVGWQASRRGLHDLIAGSYVGYGPRR